MQSQAYAYADRAREQGHLGEIDPHGGHREQYARGDEAIADHGGSRERDAMLERKPRQKLDVQERPQDLHQQVRTRQHGETSQDRRHRDGRGADLELGVDDAFCELHDPVESTDHDQHADDPRDPADEAKRVQSGTPNGCGVATHDAQPLRDAGFRQRDYESVEQVRCNDDHQPQSDRSEHGIAQH